MPRCECFSWAATPSNFRDYPPISVGRLAPLTVLRLSYPTFAQLLGEKMRDFLGDKWLEIALIATIGAAWIAVTIAINV
jgi:hypothetical protein